MIRRWLRPYSWLIGFGGLAVAAGAWEIAARSFRDRPAVETTSNNADAGLTRGYSIFVRELYPGSLDAEFFRGVQAGTEGRDAAVAREHFEHALAAGLKHHEDLFYYEAILLLHDNAPSAEIDAALRRWRIHFPKTQQPLAIPYRSFTARDAAAATVAAQQALKSVPFAVADSLKIDETNSILELRLRGSDIRIETLRGALRTAGFTFAESH